MATSSRTADRIASYYNALVRGDETPAVGLMNGLDGRERGELQEQIEFVDALWALTAPVRHANAEQESVAATSNSAPHPCYVADGAAGRKPVLGFLNRMRSSKAEAERAGR